MRDLPDMSERLGFVLTVRLRCLGVVIVTATWTMLPTAKVWVVERIQRCRSCLLVNFLLVNLSSFLLISKGFVKWAFFNASV